MASRVDWEALYAAAMQAAVVIVVLGVLVTIYLLILLVAMTTTIWLYVLAMGAAFGALTRFFYKYEKDVEDQ